MIICIRKAQVNKIFLIFDERKQYIYIFYFSHSIDKMMNFTRKVNRTIKSQNIAKKEEKQLQKLTEQANRSRIAVEHISHVRAEELENKAIGQIKKQLQSCIVKINAQQKKQHLLKQLNLLLQGEMNNIQNKDKEIKYKEQLEVQKKNKELRHDIDKIFEKMNEEVAKIGELKEKANQRRSQRVVYSKLFKKLEKELKESQEKYKESILQTQKFRLQFLISEQSLEKGKLRSSPCPPRQGFKENFSLSLSPSPPSTERFRKGHIINVRAELARKSDSRGKERDDQAEHKVQKEDRNLIQKQLLNEEEQQSINLGTNSHRRQRSRNGRMNSTRQNYQNYQIVAKELSHFCERIKREVGCENVEEIQNLFQTIGDQNLKLQRQIEEVNNEIEKVEKQAFHVSNIQNQMEIIQNQDQFFHEDIDFSAFAKVGIDGANQIIMNSFSNQPESFVKVSWIKQQEKVKNKSYINELQYQCFQEILEVLKLKERKSLSNFYPSSLVIEQYSRNIDKIVSLIKQNFKSPLNLIEQYSNQISLKKSKSAFLSVRDQSNPKASMEDCIQKAEGNSRVRILSPNQTNLFQMQGFTEYRLRRRESRRDLCSLLTKMQKYSNCEKFFDKQGFQLEYRKEVEGLEVEQKQNKKMKLRCKKTN